MAPAAAASGGAGADAGAGDAGGDQLRAVAGGVAKLMVSQVATRLVTFTMNLLVARHLSPEAYGLAAVQFHLLTTTILFLSREGFRRGGLRVQEEEEDEEEDDEVLEDERQQQQGGGASRRRAKAAGGDDSKQQQQSQGQQATAAAAATVAERVLRVTWLVLPIGALVTLVVCGAVLWQSASASSLSSKGGAAGTDADSEAAAAAVAYRQAVVAHGAAALLELAVEPLYIIASTRLEFGLRAGVDTAAMLAKCGATLALVLLAPRLQPALVFAAAQLAFGGVVALGYGAYGLRLAARGELRVRSWRWDAADRATLRVARLFGVQAAEKLLLAEGGKVALVAAGSGAYDQGVYGLVANLGSLVVRLLFAPLEEAAFAAFSREGIRVARGGGKKGGRGGGKDGDEAARAALAGALGVAVKAVALLGVLAAAFGPPYAYVALRLVYGTRWADTGAPTVLGAFCLYLPLLAVNGVAEAFVHAVLDPAGLRAANAALVAFGAAHVAASAALVRAGGAVGLVAADALNMLLRIAFSGWCVRRYFAPVRGFRLFGLLPARATLAAALLAAAAGAASSAALMAPVQVARHGFARQAALHVAAGAAALAAFAAAAARAERGTVAQLLALRRGGGGGAGGGGTKKRD